jgi:hypothetical protein
MHDVVPVFRPTPGREALQFRQRHIEVFQRAKRGGAGPSLCRRSSERIHDQPYGNVNILLYTACEVITYCRKLTCRFGCHDFPSPFDSRRRVIGRVRCDREEANVSMIGSLHLLGSIARPPQRKLHIRLTAAKPYIADEKVVQLPCFAAGNPHPVRTSNWRRLDANLPAAVGSRDTGGRLVSDLYRAQCRPVPTIPRRY